MEERSGQLRKPNFPDQLWGESHHVGLALENGQVDRLRRDVDRLAAEIGARNIYHYEALQKAAIHIETILRETGYSPSLHHYDTQGKTFVNISAELAGQEHKDEIVVIGAHYDTHKDSPGANDNGSGMAAVLALARRFAKSTPRVTLRFVAFTNEEPFHFQTKLMGSWVYADRCRARGDRITGMISLETIGYFSNAMNSQVYPLPGLGAIYPTTGNFIAFVGNVSSRALVRRALGSFRQHAMLPSEGAALPSRVPGVGWSDHWAFWEQGYSAMMITDTAPFRYPHYHTPDDTPDKVDYDRTARVVTGLARVVEDLSTRNDSRR